MSKFNNIMESKLDMTDLLRVRVKYDPANEENDLGDAKDYVGYILKEEEGGIVAIVPGLGPEPMSLDMDQFEPMSSPCAMKEDTMLIKFKQHAINYLLLKGFQQEVGRYMEDILKTHDVIDIEKLLGKCSCNPGEVLSVYRDFINNAEL